MKHIHAVLQPAPPSTSRTFLISPTELCRHQTLTPTLPSPQPVGHHHSSDSTNLISPRGIIHYLSFVLWWLASFHLVSCPQVRPCCSVGQNFLPFSGWIIAHCMYKPHFAYPFICWRTLGLLPPSDYCEECSWAWAYKTPASPRIQVFWEYTQGWDCWIIR